MTKNDCLAHGSLHADQPAPVAASARWSTVLDENMFFVTGVRLKERGMVSGWLRRLHPLDQNDFSSRGLGRLSGVVAR